MSDILERVQTAKKAAMKSFLKEYATHNLAKFMMDADSIMRESVFASKHPDFYSDLNNQDYNNALKSEAYEAIITSAGHALDSRLATVFEQKLSSNPDLLKRFNLLKSHYTGITEIIGNGREGTSGDEDSLRIRQASVHLQGSFDEAIARSHRMRERIEKDRKGEYWSPEVLVLQGGGAKGMSYAGVIEAMEDSGYLKGIKMVAGTSAGALIGLPVAMGYKAEEITQIVMHGRFAHFFAESTLKFKGLMKLKNLFVETTPEKTPHYEGDLLVEFTKNHFLPQLAEATGISVKRWSKFPEAIVQEYLQDLEMGRRPNVLKSVGSVVSGQVQNLNAIYEAAWKNFEEDLTSCRRGTDLSILKFGGVPGRSEAYHAAITCIRLERPNRMPDGDIIEAFIGDIIQEKVKAVPIDVLRRVSPQIVSLEEMRNISFDQLKQLSELWPIGNFKEFGVAATVSYMPFSLSNIVQLGYRVYEKSKEWLKGEKKPQSLGEVDKNFAFKPIFFRSYEDKAKSKQSNMPVKKAVRASMNLPFLFRAMNLNGRRVIDGGVNSNLPMGLFRDRYQSDTEAKDKMIGFMLSTIEADIEMKALHQLASTENSVLMDIIEAEFRETPLTRPLSNALRHPISYFSKIFKKFVADQVESFMANNNTLPSIEALDNIAIVNTGAISTAQFNASVKERHTLRTQGANAFLDLTGYHSDKNLRYAMGRLVSLSSIENKLLIEKGVEASFQDPMYRLRDPDLLAKCLGGSRYEEMEIQDLILPKEERKAESRKLPSHLVHFSPGFGLK
ncbi:patatin-like phospholipase family protein [Pseudomonas putida]|uniref:Patatin-like phospholipase family protein n=1 Tax=Pseudomonas putida TaxID=303 RepID=A0A8I1ECR3_PSEPU|nr:patatin-like phospholipase family protein [Pseudomonas putida]MBI6882889.1 patatin-like phospholipase family protein [Pseudomonas putida]